MLRQITSGQAKFVLLIRHGRSSVSQISSRLRQRLPAENTSPIENTSPNFLSGVKFESPELSVAASETEFISSFVTENRCYDPITRIQNSEPHGLQKPVKLPRRHTAALVQKPPQNERQHGVLYRLCLRSRQDCSAMPRIKQIEREALRAKHQVQLPKAVLGKSHRGVLGVIPTNQLAFTFGQVEGRAIAFGQQTCIEDHACQGQLEKVPGSIHLLSDDSKRLDGSHEQHHAQQGHTHGNFVGHHLGTGSKPAQE